MSSPKEWMQIFKLALHIHKNLPPKDGQYHAVSFNMRLEPRKRRDEK